MLASSFPLFGIFMSLLFFFIWMPSGTADELAKLADLHAKGVLSDSGFEAQKTKLSA